MSNKTIKHKLLLILLTIASSLAIYFGIKTKQLSDELLEQNSKLETQEKLDEIKKIAKVDSLLFKGEYKKVLNISKPSNQEKDKTNDSTMQLRYDLANRMIEFDELKKKDAKRKLLAKSFLKRENTARKQKTDSISKELVKTKQELDSITNELFSGFDFNSGDEYLTFETTKGTKLHYIGSILNDKANGYGVAILESGSRYEGEWLDNERHGEGKFFWDDGTYYEGSYKNDKREGIGTYLWANGEKYIGEWKNDKRNGNGEFYNKKGKLKTKGIWEDDELIIQYKKDKVHDLSSK